MLRGQIIGQKEKARKTHFESVDALKSSLKLILVQILAETKFCRWHERKKKTEK